MIELVDVGKSFNYLHVLDKVSFIFEKGSRTALAGPSGSGKTTLLNLIAGLVPLDKGLIRIDGVVSDTPSASIHPSRRNIGFAFQFPALWPHMTVKGNILYGLWEIDKKERIERLHNILEVLEITDIVDKYPGEISGGQAKRVSLARTMVVKPRYLLLDEPLNNLDRDLREKVLDVIRKQVEAENTTLIYVTHDIGEVNGICDRTCCIKERKIFVSQTGV